MAVSSFLCYNQAADYAGSTNQKGLSDMDTERIRKMESTLEKCTAATAELNTGLARMDHLRESMIELFQYYGSDAWYEDREGNLPEGLAAGVLSEDLVYDAITDLRDAAFHMLELATDILKNRL